MAQVGMPTSEPKGALDLNTTTNTNTYGLVLPTTDNPKQKIRNPNENNNLTRVEGTMIYDSRQDCVRIFQKGVGQIAYVQKEMKDVSIIFQDKVGDSIFL